MEGEDGYLVSHLLYDGCSGLSYLWVHSGQPNPTQLSSPTNAHVHMRFGRPFLVFF